MTPFERRDMKWIVAAAVLVVCIIVLIKFVTD